MNRRSVYLQEIPLASDLLQIQRNSMVGLGALIEALYGDGPTYISIPPASIPTFPGGLVVRPPRGILHQKLATFDPAWPAAPNTILSADTTPVCVQALSLTQSNITYSAPAGGTAANSYFVLVQARILAAQEQSPVVLPFYPLIQTTVIADAGNTSQVFRVASRVGIRVGDPIVVVGIATSDGIIALVDSFDQAGPAIPNIRLNKTLVSIPPNGTIVNDIVPNAGNPLNGIGNNGVALVTDRLDVVEFTLKVGVPSTTPVVPTADAGFTPLWFIGPIIGNATNLAVTLPVITPHGSAPILPSLVGASHHVSGLPGHSLPINLTTEVSYPAVAGGALSLVGDPNAPLQATPKRYVDSVAASAVTTGLSTGLTVAEITLETLVLNPTVTPGFVILFGVISGVVTQPAGNVTLSVRLREDGLQIDTTASNFIGSGVASSSVPFTGVVYVVRPLAVTRTYTLTIQSTINGVGSISDTKLFSLQIH